MFERNWRSQHLQLQVLLLADSDPVCVCVQVIPVDMTDSSALRQSFIDHGRRYKIEFTEVPSDVDPLQVSISIIL